jgi:hypothetical protein
MVITDNGCGIGKIDLELAAAAICDFKLRTHGGLSVSGTFGFCGEALEYQYVARLVSLVALPPAPLLTPCRIDGKPENNQWRAPARSGRP